MKFETFDSDSQLKCEYDIYTLIQEKADCKKGFPHAFYFGKYLHYQVLVMELLGQNLETVFESCGRRFALKTLIFVTLQLLKRFETLHSLHVVFRDVKPENFVLGSETNTIYVIDFGLSKFFVDSHGKHLPYQVTNEYIGTARYMSINAHNCREQGRRDDLEALGYVFVYFIRGGKLPWSGVRVPTFKEHNKVVLTMKKTIPEEDLCAGAPEEFLFYMKYVRFLEFDAAPCYMRLRNTFKRLFQRHNFADNGTYDWNMITGKQRAALKASSNSDNAGNT